jgi:hypothetical protein
MLEQAVTIPQALQLVPHKSFARAQLLLVAGKRDQGKTTFVTGYIETNEPRVLIIDPFNDFGRVRRRLDLDDAIEDLLEYPTACRRRVVPEVSIEWDENGDPRPTLETRRYFERLVGKLVSRKVRNLLLVLDELTLWTTPRGSELLELLIFQGRRFNIRVATAIQRMALTPGAMQAEWSSVETAERASKLQVGQCLVVMP